MAISGPTTLRSHVGDDQTNPVAPPAKAMGKEKKSTKAKRALRSLAIGLGMNLSLSVAVMFMFGSGKKYDAIPAKPVWFPPLWLVHMASLGSSFFMGLASWLMWAEGGFDSGTDALPVFIAEVSLRIVWDPLILVMGANRVGLVFCLVHLGTLMACKHNFGKANPLAGDFVRPSIMWVGFLSVVTSKLVFMQ